jgi:hypothetical protein
MQLCAQLGRNNFVHGKPQMLDAIALASARE